jgi:choline dehydrogenase-like flavoprotein
MEASMDGICSGNFVVARRLAESPEVSVLLIEAGGEDNVPSVNKPGQWFLNLGSERRCSLTHTNWESVAVHSTKNVHRFQDSRYRLAFSAQTTVIS